MADAPGHFLDIADETPDHLFALLDAALQLKSGALGGRPLEGQTLAMIFRKSSTRTRVSFEAGMTQLGGHGIFLSDRDSQMGRGESVADTAKVLSGFVNGIMIRTFGHDEVLHLAAEASVPVINGLTDLLHPCQLMADVLTMVEEFGTDLSDVPVAWIGDGNNMANSWINAALRFGFPLRLACPEGYDPDPTILERGQREGDITLVRDPRTAAQDARVVTTDVWASMGQEEEQAVREAAFAGFEVEDTLMGRAHPSAIFLHCLPAHRGEEVAASVIDGPQSRVFQEAENRLHAQKAILLDLMA